MIVVTGCGRSGTGYAAALLSALEIECGHERVFTPETQVAPRDLGGLTADASWLAAPFLSDLPDGAVVLHQVRDPVAVVASLLGIRFFSHPRRAPISTRMTDGVELARRAIVRKRRRPIRRDFVRFIQRHEPVILEPHTELERTVTYWVRWNMMIERLVGSRPYLRYRVEDMDARLVGRILGLAGVSRSADAIERVLASVPTSINSRRRST